MRAAIVILLLPLITSCGKTSAEVLRAKGRPEPIECIRVSDEQDRCSDGGGVGWACHKNLGDNECVATGQVNPEVVR